MKTIFVTAPDGFHNRILLRSATFEVLRRRARLVILAANAHEDYFRKEFEAKGCVVEQLDPVSETRWRKFSEVMRNEIVASRKLTQTMNIKYDHLRLRSFPRYYFRRGLNHLVGRSQWIRRHWHRIDRLFFHNPHYLRLFAAYQPDLLLVATPGWKWPDIPVLFAASSLGIPSASVILSWDNLTSKGQMAARPDRLVVWNEIMQREAVELHEYDPSHVHVAGSAQFDPYFSPAADVPGRATFLTTLGLDPNKAVVTLATTSHLIYDRHAEVLDLLLQASAQGRFVRPCQILVRPHPRDRVDTYERFTSIPEVRIDNIGRFSSAAGWDPTEQDLRHLASTLAHSDVVLNVASTTTIDACCFDRPVVNIAFDGFESRSYGLSAQRYYDYSHFSRITALGATTIARTPVEMVDAINAYLTDPSRHREGRRRVVSEFVFYTDGRSGERVGQYLLQYLHEVAESRAMGKH